MELYKHTTGDLEITPDLHIDDLRGQQEGEASWQRRRRFLQVHLGRYPIGRLNQLSYCFSNTLMYACGYSESLMKELSVLAVDVAIVSARERGDSSVKVSKNYLAEKMANKKNALLAEMHYMKKLHELRKNKVNCQSEELNQRGDLILPVRSLANRGSPLQPCEQLVAVKDDQNLRKSSKLSPLGQSSELSPLRQSSKLSPLGQSSELSPLRQSSELSSLRQCSELSPLRQSFERLNITPPKELSSLQFKKETKTSSLVGTPWRQYSELSPLRQSSELSPLRQNSQLSPLRQSSQLPPFESLKVTTPEEDNCKKYEELSAQQIRKETNPSPLIGTPRLLCSDARRQAALDTTSVHSLKRDNQRFTLSPDTDLSRKLQTVTIRRHELKPVNFEPMTKCLNRGDTVQSLRPSSVDLILGGRPRGIKLNTDQPDQSNRYPGNSDPSNRYPSDRYPSNSDPNNRYPSNSDPSNSDPSNSKNTQMLIKNDETFQNFATNNGQRETTLGMVDINRQLAHVKQRLETTGNTAVGKKQREVTKMLVSSKQKGEITQMMVKAEQHERVSIRPVKKKDTSYTTKYPGLDTRKNLPQTQKCSWKKVMTAHRKGQQIQTSGNLKDTEPRTNVRVDSKAQNQFASEVCDGLRRDVPPQGAEDTDRNLSDEPPTKTRRRIQTVSSSNRPSRHYPYSAAKAVQNRSTSDTKAPIPSKKTLCDARKLIENLDESSHSTSVNVPETRPKSISRTVDGPPRESLHRAQQTYRQLQRKKELTPVLDSDAPRHAASTKYGTGEEATAGSSKSKIESREGSTVRSKSKSASLEVSTVRSKSKGAGLEELTIQSKCKGASLEESTARSGAKSASLKSLVARSKSKSEGMEESTVRSKSKGESREEATAGSKSKSASLKSSVYVVRSKFKIESVEESTAKCKSKGESLKQTTARNKPKTILRLEEPKEVKIPILKSKINLKPLRSS